MTEARSILITGGLGNVLIGIFGTCLATLENSASRRFLPRLFAGTLGVAGGSLAELWCARFDRCLFYPP